MSERRDLLFAVLAVQLGFADPRQVMAAAAAWSADPSLGIAERLERDGTLAKDKCRLLEGLVDQAIEQHGGDAKRTLDSLGGEAAVFRSFGGSLVVSEEGAVSVLSETVSEIADFDSVPKADPGRYVISSETAELGRGGIGRVVAAYDQNLGREIAIKELLADARVSGASGGSQTAAEQRFLLEARVTGQLQHPNIVPVHELAQREDGTVFYTMKLVRGQTLEQALSASKGVKARLALLPRFIDLTNAVAYAHSRGVVHRDLKPANVMLGEFGETVVLDWGLAKVRGQEDLRAQELAPDAEQLSVSSGSQTVEGHAVGTPAYMSPEQAEGLVAEMDEQSDVWSLGAVLYELLTGAPPFEGKTAYEVIGKVIKEAVPSVQEKCPEAPPELVSIVDRALSRKKRHRYASAANLAADVAAYQAGARVGAHVYSSSELLARFVRRYQLPLAIAGVALLILGVVAAGAYREVRDERDRAVIAETNVRRERDRTRTTLAAALAERAQTEASRGNLATAEIYAAASLSHAEGPVARGLLIDLANQPRPQYLWQSRPGAQCVGLQYSPSGRKLGCAGLRLDGVLVWDVRRGTEVARVSSGEQVTSFRWLDEQRLLTTHTDGSIREFVHDRQKRRFAKHQGQVFDAAVVGQRVVSVGQDQRVRVWDMTTEDETADLDGHAMLVSVALSPDGQRAVTTSTDATARLWSIDPPKQLAEYSAHPRIARGVAFSPDGTWFGVAASKPAVDLYDVEGRAQASLPVKEQVRALAVSADGRRLAAGSVEGEVTVWDVATRQLLHRWTVTGGVLTLAFAPNGRELAVSTLGSIVSRFELPSGEKRWRLSGHGSFAYAVDFSPDASELASGGWDGTLRRWNADTGEPLSVIPAGHIARHWAAVSFSPDGKLIAASGMANVQTKAATEVYDAASGRLVHRLVGAGNAFDQDFSADGKLLAVGYWQGLVRLWNVDEKTVLRDMKTDRGFQPVRFSPTGDVVAYGSGKTVRVERLDGTPVLELDQPSRVPRLAFGPEGRRLLTANFDTRLRIDALDGSAPTVELVGHEGEARAGAFLDGGRKVITGAGDRTARLWDANTGKELGRLFGHAGKIYGVAAAADGRTFATASEDYTVRVWRTEQQASRRLVGHRAPIIAFRLFGAATRAVTMDRKGEVRIWDLASRNALHTLNVDQGTSGFFNGGSTRIALSPDEKELLVAGAGGFERWDPENGRRLEHTPFANPVITLAVCSDGRVIAGSLDGGAYLFSPDTKRVLVGDLKRGLFPTEVFCLRDGRIIVARESLVILYARDARTELTRVEPPLGASVVALNPEQTTVAFGSSSRTISLWSITNGTLSPAIRAHDNWVEKLAFSPDGRWLVSSGRDGTARLWDVQTRRELARITKEVEARAVGFTPDGGTLVAADEENALAFYSLGSLEAKGDDLLLKAQKDFGVVLDGMRVEVDPDLLESRFEAVSDRSRAKRTE